MKLIAEIGGNHEGDQRLAIDYAKAAIDHGVKFIKYQLYSAEGLVNPVVDSNRFEHFGKYALSKDTFEKIATICLDNGVEVMSSSWDSSSLSFVDDFVSRHKIGSGDFDNKKLVGETFDLGKPVIMSCGLNDLNRIGEVINWVTTKFPNYDNPQMLTIMHCTAVYPCPDTEVNLRFISVLKSLFPKIDVGFSDHSIGLDALRICNILGVNWVEKHFSLTRETSTFRDHKCSIAPNEIASLRSLLAKDNRLLGGFDSSIKPTIGEITSNHITSFKRACFLRNGIKKGDVIMAENLIMLRPNIGVSAWDYERLIGKKAKQNIEAMSPIFPEMVVDFNVR